MQCPNCEFHNAPGAVRCGRCSGRLTFDDVDVVPPRASSSRAVRYAGRAADRTGFLLRDVFQSVGADLSRPRWMHLSFDGVTPRELVLCVVPGLAHIRRGHLALGRLLLGVWLLLLLVALLNIGSGLCVLAVLGAISVHCASVTLLLSGVLQELSILRRMLVGFVTYALVFGFLYFPAYSGLRSVFRVIPVISQAKSDVVRAGDVLLGAGPLLSRRDPQRGDVVLYRLDEFSLPGVVISEGAWVDRIVGNPGDHVEVRAGTLFVNGDPAPPELRPLGNLSKCPDLDLVAGPGHFIIIPSLVTLSGHGAYQRYAAGAMAGVSVVPKNNIESRVLCRVRPLLRAGRLRADLAPHENPSGASP